MSEVTPPAAQPGAVEEWLQALPFCIGEILVRRNDDGAFRLCHRDDAERETLELSREPEAAVAIARGDDAAIYRPLKTAPNLRHGWALVLRNPAEVRRALDHFYPARLAAYGAFRRGILPTTPLRETLKRQTGMYRAAATISDAEADLLVANFCRSDGGCLRTILWKRDATGGAASPLLPTTKFDLAHDQTGRGERALPLLCQEACNLLVAEARKVVKARGTTSP